MTLNLNYTEAGHGVWAVRRARVVELIRRHAPDFIALQAVRADPSVADGADQARQLAAYLPEYPHTFFAAAQVLADDRINGSACLARHPFVPPTTHELPFDETGEDRNRRVLLHVPLEGCEVFNAHFSWVPALNLNQTQTALEQLRRITRPAVLLGDLNASPDSAGMRAFTAAGWTDAWAHRHPDAAGYTFPVDAPRQRIDYAWLNPTALPRLRHIELLATDDGAGCSDHLGLLVTLQDSA